jgi:hypothetical protein
MKFDCYYVNKLDLDKGKEGDVGDCRVQRMTMEVTVAWYQENRALMSPGTRDTDVS